jgi:NADPH:quinone reductase-like Zn-dependent oxidoreductase
MWAVELQGLGLDKLAAVERAQPQPGEGELLVRIRAASLNYRDLAVARGDYGVLRSFPFVPLSDGAGEVVSVGEGVSRFQPGDRVIFTMRPLWHDGQPSREAIGTSLGLSVDGVLVEYRLAREEHLVRTPDHLSDEQAASLPIAAVTAWTALVVNGQLRQGESVVVQGTGGVALFALQFARQLGARTILVSRSDEKLERGRSLGADDLINSTTTPEWQNEVLALTGGEGADHVLDLGGASSLDRSLDALRPGGKLYLIGFLGGTKVELDLPKVFRRAPVIYGLSVGPRSAFEEMNDAISRWKLEPVVDRTFERDALREAFDYMESGQQFGKIALRI